MAWKIYLSYGMMKCGSTLAFKLTRELFKQNGLNQRLLPDELIEGPRPSNFMPVLSREMLDRALEISAERKTRLVIKTHAAPTEAVADLLASGVAIGHAVFRDPREMALSFVDHGARSRAKGVETFANHHSIDGTLSTIHRQIKLLENWCALPGIHPWFYDDFAFDKVGMIARLRAQTGLNTDTRALLDGFDDRTKMQFNRGVKGRWKEDMATADAERFAEEFKDFFPVIESLRRTWRKTRPNLFERAMYRLGYR